MAQLRRVEVRRPKTLRCRLGAHRLVDVDGVVEFLGLVSQCSRCNIVEVFFPLTSSCARGSHHMLRGSSD